MSYSFEILYFKRKPIKNRCGGSKFSIGLAALLEFVIITIEFDIISNLTQFQFGIESF